MSNTQLSELKQALTDLLDGTCYPEDIVRWTGLTLERAQEILSLYYSLVATERQHDEL